MASTLWQWNRFIKGTERELDIVVSLRWSLEEVERLQENVSAWPGATSKVVGSNPLRGSWAGADTAPVSWPPNSTIK